MSWIKATVIAETRKALYLRPEHGDDDDAQWIPRACIDDLTEEFAIGEMIDADVQSWKLRDLGWSEA